MKKLSALILLTSIVVFAGACAHSQIFEENRTENYKVIASEKLGPEPVYDLNPDKTHVLAYKQEKKSARNPNPFLHFLLYDIANDKLIYEDKLSSGSVKWINDFQIEVETIPGAVSSENLNKKYGYIFDVKTGKRIELTNNNQSKNQ